MMLNWAYDMKPCHLPCHHAPLHFEVALCEFLAVDALIFHVFACKTAGTFHRETATMNSQISRMSADNRCLTFSSKQKNILKIRSNNYRTWKKFITQDLHAQSVRLNVVEVPGWPVTALKEVSHQIWTTVAKSSLQSCFAYSLSHGRTPSSTSTCQAN